MNSSLGEIVATPIGWRVYVWLAVPFGAVFGAAAMVGKLSGYILGDTAYWDWPTQLGGVVGAVFGGLVVAAFVFQSVQDRLALVVKHGEVEGPETAWYWTRRVSIPRQQMRWLGSANGRRQMIEGVDGRRIVILPNLYEASHILKIVAWAAS